MRRCVSLGIPVRACSRAPIDPAALLGEAAASAIVPWSSPLVTLVDGVDVARSSSEASSVGTPAPSPSDAALAAAVAGARLVVFAATASASGDPNAVDHLGCAATARACVAAGVPRLVLVSGAGVTRRASDAYRFLNLFGRRMDAKVAGEAALRAVFREASRGSGSFSSKKRVGDEEEEGGERGEPRGPAPSYTIVRPSGLLDGPGRGPAALATNQGDVAAGFIDRADVAACCVAAGLSGSCAGCTFEVYAAGTAVSAETLAVSDILSDPAARRVARALEAAANRRTKGEREGGDDAVTARERRGGTGKRCSRGSSGTRRRSGGDA